MAITIMNQVKKKYTYVSELTPVKQSEYDFFSHPGKK